MRERSKEGKQVRRHCHSFRKSERGQDSGAGDEVEMAVLAKEGVSLHCRLRTYQHPGEC